jgi:phosphoribosyl 1,2-cyclic phosphodiesterase
MLLKFWGVHGSLPRPGPSTLKYGGNTACVKVRVGETIIIFDAGSGIRELGEDILRRTDVSGGKPRNVTGHIFISHLHWDHIQGFPFFAPAFVKGNELHLHGWRTLDATIHRVLNDQMSSPNFPRKHWGHSTWEGAVWTAEIARVKQLILFHHGNDDKTVEEIERKAQARFPLTRAAYEGLEIEL